MDANIIAYPEAREVSFLRNQLNEYAASVNKEPQFDQVIIVEYLEKAMKENMFLEEMILSGDRPISNMFKYIYKMAEKEATKGATCIAIEGNKVFGWAVEYYMLSEEGYQKQFAPKPKPAPKKETAKKTKSSKKKTKVEIKPEDDEEPTLDLEDDEEPELDLGEPSIESTDFVPDVEGEGMAVFSDCLPNQVNIFDFMNGV